jgi:hypothetical protein
VPSLQFSFPVHTLLVLKIGTRTPFIQIKHAEIAPEKPILESSVAQTLQREHLRQAEPSL